MNYSTVIFLINDQARAIMCTYEKGDTADRTMYKTLDKTIEVDDFVVIPTGTRHGMTVCKVVEVDVEVDLDSTTEVVWIVGTVETTDFDKIKSMEGDAIVRIKDAEKSRRREELGKNLAEFTDNSLKALPVYTKKD